MWACESSSDDFVEKLIHGFNYESIAEGKYFCAFVALVT